MIASVLSLVLPDPIRLVSRRLRIFKPDLNISPHASAVFLRPYMIFMFEVPVLVCGWFVRRIVGTLASRGLSLACDLGFATEVSSRRHCFHL
ncbi:hypothetical protein PoB_007616000 [Plakobranchus ocellatus]|uniref:Uncharacterized protein n=1 Tax=Plakobranchus ocellatus TaxID=259542 RepID=A0AAV4E080_9GAST|nr:hypothetical protein PoB_007616000 [Plakobranchus ocellatus]